MTDFLSLADDTTGAIEVTAKFISAGIPAITALHALDSGADWPAGAVVVDCQTRHATSQETYRTIAELARRGREQRIPSLYVKTDSTLRGNIAQTFEALLDVYPERALIYVPAYPAMRRTVSKGILLVDGRPLAETEFDTDRPQSVPESCICQLLKNTCCRLVESVGDANTLDARLATGAAGSIFVCDGATEQDIASIGAVLWRYREVHLAAGTGGFAGYWIRSQMECTGGLLPISLTDPFLVICGSLNPVSSGQLQRAGIPSFTLGADEEGDVALAADVLNSTDWTIVQTPRQSLSAGSEIKRRIAALVKRVVESGKLRGLVVFGGDTARAVLDTLGVRSLRTHYELLTGIPLSSFHYRKSELLLVTKAGGFGSPTVLCDIQEKLAERKT